MSTAYIDTSVLVAIDSDEPNTEILYRKLRQYDLIVSSTFFEAEYRSVCTRRNRIPSCSFTLFI